MTRRAVPARAPPACKATGGTCFRTRRPLPEEFFRVEQPLLDAALCTHAEGSPRRAHDQLLRADMNAALMSLVSCIDVTVESTLWVLAFTSTTNPVLPACSFQRSP